MIVHSHATTELPMRLWLRSIEFNMSNNKSFNMNNKHHVHKIKYVYLITKYFHWHYAITSDSAVL